MKSFKNSFARQQLSSVWHWTLLILVGVVVFILLDGLKCLIRSFDCAPSSRYVRFGSLDSRVDTTGRGIAPRAGLPLGLRLRGRGRVERLMTRRRYRKWMEATTVSGSFWSMFTWLVKELWLCLQLLDSPLYLWALCHSPPSHPPSVYFENIQ